MIKVFVLMENHAFLLTFLKNYVWIMFMDFVPKVFICKRGPLCQDAHPKIFNDLDEKFLKSVDKLLNIL